MPKSRLNDEKKLPFWVMSSPNSVSVDLLWIILFVIFSIYTRKKAHSCYYMPFFSDPPGAH